MRFRATPAAPVLEENGSLFSALINPGADQAYLFRGEWTDSGFVMRRGHVVVGIADMGNIMYEQTVRTLAWLNNFAILTAFENAFQAVELELPFWFLVAVAFNARFIKNGLNISGIRYVLLVCGGRKFADIHLDFSLLLFLAIRS